MKKYKILLTFAAVLSVTAIALYGCNNSSTNKNESNNSEVVEDSSENKTDNSSAESNSDSSPENTTNNETNYPKETNVNADIPTTYTKEDISKNGVVTGESGIKYGWAGDSSSLTSKVINDERCLFVMDDDSNSRYVGLNTLNIYDEDNKVIDKANLK